MGKHWHTQLSRRERQIMEIVYQRGTASAADVMDNLPDPPGYSAVRAMLRILEEKGYLEHEKQGPRYVFRPTLPRDEASRSALRQLLRTFFDGSVEQAVAALPDTGLLWPHVDHLFSFIVRSLQCLGRDNLLGTRAV